MELTLIIKETKSKTMDGALNNNNRVNLINGIRMYVTRSRINSNFSNHIRAIAIVNNNNKVSRRYYKRKYIIYFCRYARAF